MAAVQSRVRCARPRGRASGGEEDWYQPKIRKPLDDAQGARFDAQYVLNKEARADKTGAGEPKQDGNLSRRGEETRYGLQREQPRQGGPTSSMS
jgi:hypothetical protein